MTLGRNLTPYELEVAEAMTARQDAGRHLLDVIAEDLAGYEDGMAMVRGGNTMEILAPPSAGQIRQAMSDAVAEFEAARHRFRLSLVAVAVDHGLTARMIGDAFGFSRQLASRYLKEARQKWPDLEHHEDDVAECLGNEEVDTAPLVGPAPPVGPAPLAGPISTVGPARRNGDPPSTPRRDAERRDRGARDRDRSTPA